jgi:DNA-binding beta-propeller fold protein YncE
MISRARATACALALTAPLAACTASSEEVRPPEDAFFFPTGLATSPDERFLFAVSANSDLRYDSGSILVIDLEAVDRVVTEYKASGAIDAACHEDLDTAGTIECEEAPFFLGGAGVRIGNFTSSIAVQDKGGGNLRVLAPVRGDPSVTWAEWDGTSLSCGGGQGFGLCDDAHRLTRMREDDDLPELAAEPYDIYVDSVAGLAAVTHLSSGTVTLVDTPADGTPVLADALGGLFGGSGSARGATGVAGRQAGDGNILYVQSRTEDRIQMIGVARESGGLPFLVPSSYFFLNGVGGAGGTSSDSRGVTFDPSGDRAYMINRSPPSLMVYDTSIDSTGIPINRLVGATDLCREASGLAIADGGAGIRAFVTCFQNGEVYVVDPRGAASVEAVTSVGRGPFAMAAAENRQLLFVSTFLDDSIAVLDLDPASPNLYRVIMRLGVRP